MIFRALTLSLGLATLGTAFAMSATPPPAPATPAVQAPAPIFVLNSLEGNVSVIDPVTWTETKRIPTGKEPHHLYMTPDEKSVIVANALSDSLTSVSYTHLRAHETG
jgi:YVTN family beta-propeller protein